MDLQQSFPPKVFQTLIKNTKLQHKRIRYIEIFTHSFSFFMVFIKKDFRKLFKSNYILHTTLTVKHLRKYIKYFNFIIYMYIVLYLIKE